jgi:hypothetical protein
VKPLMPQPRVPIPGPVGGVELTACPQCQAPASIVAARGLNCAGGGIDGRVEHVRVWCADGHWFLMPRDALAPLPPYPGRNAPAPPETDAPSASLRADAENSPVWRWEAGPPDSAP